MKTAATFLVPVLLAPTVIAGERKPWNVDRVCGRVQYVQRIPVKKRPDNFSEKRNNLSGIPLELYEFDEAPSCCDSSKSVGRTTSGKSGQFEFKPGKAGHYWLTAKWNGRDYKVAVVFEPEKQSSTICSQQGIQIEDAGDASWWVTVTVD